MLNQINLLDGIITYDNISWLNSHDYEENKKYLTEDLCQISYFNGRYIIDIGWYPEFNENGQFTIMVVYLHNWVGPIYIKKTVLLKDLPLMINKCINLIYNHCKLNT